MSKSLVIDSLDTNYTIIFGVPVMNTKLYKNAHPSSINTSRTKLSVSALAGSTVVVGDVLALSRADTIGISKGIILGHAIVCTVELHVGNAVITFDAGGLLKSLGNVIVNLSEDSDLSLDKFLLLTHFHLSSDVVDEPLTGWLVKYLLPKCSWTNEVFGSDLRQEGDGLALEMSVSLIIIHSSSSELNGINGAQIIGTGTLVEESHTAISLEVASFEASL